MVKINSPLDSSVILAVTKFGQRSPLTGPQIVERCEICTIFSVRQHIVYMLSALYAMARPFVCLSVTRVDHKKRLKLGLRNFYHTVAPCL